MEYSIQVLEKQRQMILDVIDGNSPENVPLSFIEKLTDLNIAITLLKEWKP